MSEDEEGTLARLKALRREIIEPSISAHQGRTVKLMGDGTLVEFSSALDAVRCAVEVQQAVEAAQDVEPEGRRIAFRVGINLGDILIDQDDIYGDGVNIAARLEGLAESGGICVSGAIFDQVRNNIDLEFEDLGPQTVKNVVEPVRAYRLRTGSKPKVARAPPAERRAVPDRASVAVLPFVNMSGDPEQEYFADGMVDEIITALSRLHGLFVAARTSSFMFKGQAIDVRDIAHKLGVRYVLEGSVRKSGDRIRIIGQLIDGATGDHLWADRFDGELADIFDLQDKITDSVVGAIEPTMRSAEIERAKRKRPDSLDAYDYYLRALPHYYASTREGSVEGLRLIDKALELDPAYAPANAVAAWFHFNMVTHGWSANPEHDSAQGLRLARAALDAGTCDPVAMANAGWVLAILARDPESGVAAIDRAVKLSPKSAHVLSLGGWIMTFVGDQEKALARCNAALKLSPSDMLAHRFLTGAAVANLLMGRFEDAVELAEEARRRNARWGPTFRTLAAAHAQLGRQDKAAEALSRLLELEPTATIAHYRERLPYQDPQQAERLWNGLSMAGLPE